MAKDPSELIDSEFSHLSTEFFNSAYLGPSPLRAKQAAEDALARELDPSGYAYEDWRKVPDGIREKIATIVGCRADAVALHASVSDAISKVAQGFPFRPGDLVVAMRGDYPANILPWMVQGPRRGFELSLLDEDDVFDPGRLVKSLPAGTRVFAISHVLFNSGRRLDIAATAERLRERGIFVVVDASQSLGGVHLDHNDRCHIDVLAFAAYKWLLGPYGTAAAVYSEEALDVLPRTSGNWMASAHSAAAQDLLNYSLETLPGARKYDRGQTPNLLASAVLAAGLDLLAEVGAEWVDRHNSRLAQRFIEELNTSAYELQTPKSQLAHIVSLRCRGVEPDALANRLREKRVEASVREGNLRLSFHLFNTEDQVVKLAGLLNELL